MKFRKLLTFATVITAAISCQSTQQMDMDTLIDSSMQKAMIHSINMAESLKDSVNLVPRSFEHGVLTTSDSSWWCCGFYPGVLWYLYEYSNDEQFREYAELFTARVENRKFSTNTHDLGFMLYCSFGNGLRLTGNSDYVEVLTTGANSLSTRYNPNIGLIRSWDFNKKTWQYPVIIDNMMNLELLTWASKQTGDDRFKQIAVSHADRTIENHYREDNSCYHVVSYDTISARPHIKQTWQGASNDSAWARGQAWGLYGYSLMYRETGEAAYLDMAKAIAEYMIYHPNMPEDLVPYWDYNAPNIPNEERDASAAALMASALIEMSGFVDDKLSAEYLRVAEKQIRSLSSPEYFAEIGTNGNFILMHSTGSKPYDSEVDTPLTYADYYYLEALLRYKNLK